VQRVSSIDCQPRAPLAADRATQPSVLLEEERAVKATTGRSVAPNNGWADHLLFGHLPPAIGVAMIKPRMRNAVRVISQDGALSGVHLST
jgi:hypothetical protein